MKWCNNGPKYVQVSESLRLQCPLSLRTDEIGQQLLCHFLLFWSHEQICGERGIRESEQFIKAK